MKKILAFLGIGLFKLMAIAQTPVEQQKVQNEQNIAVIQLELENDQDAQKQFYLLSDIVQKYASEKITQEMKQDIKKSANLLLDMSDKYKTDWNYGNAVHHAHLVLGRLELFEGNVTNAKNELKLAAKTPGSPQLDSFGPNMTLAKELLENGEKEAVLDYFNDCRGFWKSKSAEPLIEKWKTDIANNKIPDFQAHLVY